MTRRDEGRQAGITLLETQTLICFYVTVQRDTINVTILFILPISLIYQMYIFTFIEENFYF